MEQMTLFGEPVPIKQEMRYEEKIEHSMDVLRTAADIADTFYHKSLIVCVSGGKDSDLMIELAIRSGIEFEVLHSVTTLDAAETNAHINRQFRRLKAMGIKTEKKIPMRNGEKTNMWKLIEEIQCPPTRIARWCCSILKETSTPNRIVALGVRKAESIGRGGRSDFGNRGKTYKDARFFSLQHTKDVIADAKRIAEEYGKPIEEPDVYDCTMIKDAKENKALICNPIYEWTDIEVWRYIKQNNIEVNPLYERGFKRVGCIGCPMAGGRTQIWEFKQYPNFKERFIKAFDRMLEHRRESGKDDITGKEGYHRWETGQDVFNWWVSDNRKDIYGQMDFNGLMEDT